MHGLLSNSEIFKNSQREHSGEGKMMETVKRSVVVGGSGEGGEGRTGKAPGIYRAVKLFSMKM